MALALAATGAAPLRPEMEACARYLVDNFSASELDAIVARMRLLCVDAASAESKAPSVDLIATKEPAALQSTTLTVTTRKEPSTALTVVKNESLVVAGTKDEIVAAWLLVCFFVLFFRVGDTKTHSGVYQAKKHATTRAAAILGVPEGAFKNDKVNPPDACVTLLTLRQTASAPMRAILGKVDELKRTDASETAEDAFARFATDPVWVPAPWLAAWQGMGLVGETGRPLLTHAQAISLGSLGAPTTNEAETLSTIANAAAAGAMAGATMAVNSSVAAASRELLNQVDSVGDAVNAVARGVGAAQRELAEQGKQLSGLGAAQQQIAVQQEFSDMRIEGMSKKVTDQGWTLNTLTGTVGDMENVLHDITTHVTSVV
jgi:hypothetical protein